MMIGNRITAVAFLAIGLLLILCACRNLPVFSQEDNTDPWEDTLVCQVGDSLYYRDEQCRLSRMDMETGETGIVLDYAVFAPEDGADRDPDDWGQQIFSVGQGILYYTVRIPEQSDEEQFRLHYALYRYEEGTPGPGQLIIDNIGDRVERMGSILFFSINGEDGYRKCDLETGEISRLAGEAPYNIDFDADQYDGWVARTTRYDMLLRSNSHDSGGWNWDLLLMDRETGEEKWILPVDRYDQNVNLMTAFYYFREHWLYMAVNTCDSGEPYYDVLRYDFGKRDWQGFVHEKGYLLAQEKADGQWYMLARSGEEDRIIFARFDFREQCLKTLAEYPCDEVNRGEFDLNVLIIEDGWCFGYSVGEWGVDALGFVDHPAALFEAGE